MFDCVLWVIYSTCASIYSCNLLIDLWFSKDAWYLLFCFYQNRYLLSISVFDGSYQLILRCCFPLQALQSSQLSIKIQLHLTFCRFTCDFWLEILIFWTPFWVSLFNCRDGNLSLIVMALRAYLKLQLIGSIFCISSDNISWKWSSLGCLKFWCRNTPSSPHFFAQQVLRNALPTSYPTVVTGW